MAEVLSKNMRTKKKIVRGMKKHLESMSNEALRDALAKRKQCTEKAQHIVTCLIEPHVDESWFLENLIHLNQCHLDDVVDERILLSLCGYPLCSNVLSNIPYQRYRISTKTNTVYDIMERKKFCSNECYKGYDFLKAQMYTSPLWLRDMEKIIEFQLYKPEATLSAGVEMDIRLTDKFETEESHIFENDDIINQLEKALDCIEIKSMNALNESVKTTDPPMHNDLNSLNEPEDNPQEEEPYDCLQNGIGIGEIDLTKKEGFNENQEDKHIAISDQKILISHDEEQFLERRDFNKRRKQLHRSEGSLKEVIIGIEQKVRDWMTVETLKYLLGEETVKDLFKRAGAEISINTKCIEEIKNEEILQRLENVVLKGDILEKSNEAVIGSLNAKSERGKKPIPNFEDLKREAKDIEIKVKAFYRGDKVVTFKEEKDEQLDENSDYNHHVLPLIDNYSVNATRRKILLTKLTNSIEEVRMILGFSKNHNFDKQLKDLISTFALGPTNILFRPSELSMLAIMVIKLLTLREPSLHHSFNSFSVKTTLDALLKAFDLDAGYLDRLVQYLTDIGPFLCASSLSR